MEASEFKGPAATVRVHQDFVEPVTDGRMARLSRIVSESYRRRAREEGGGAAAAFAPKPGGREI